MNRVHKFSLIIASLFLFLSVTAQESGNPFAPEPAPPLPAGMTGSNANDPRAKLSPGLYDAGETAFGIKHLLLLKKPDAFNLGSDDLANQKVKDILSATGTDASKISPAMQLIFAQLAFANSDLAFQGNHLFLGNFYGMNIFDISDPAKTKLVTSMLCPGGQGDVSVYKNLMFMSVEQLNGRLDCGTQSFPPTTDGQAEAAEKDRFRGIRIFDISDIAKPKQVAAVQTCRGSHTHTLVTDPNDKNNVYIYNSGAAGVRPAEELAGCSDEMPKVNPKTALFSIDVIKVPVNAPQNAKIVSSPRLFMDSRTGVINALKSAKSHDAPEPVDTDQCHDITVYSAIGLAAGACSGNGILLDIKDPANPKRIDAVNDPNYSYWHSASFSNDGKKVVFTDEWGGGMGARCRETDPNKWGANSIFHLRNNKLSFASYYKLPAAQGDTENCVAHNGSLVPVPGRDIKVQAWYQGGISVMDFTIADRPVEIAYFDRGPIYPNMLILGGSWSAYWYNGHIYSSEIARGLDIFELTPTKNLTQNEIDAAKSVQVKELNVQNQEKMEWPNFLVVAKAYLDQLERSKAMPASKIGSLRSAIEKYQGSPDKFGQLKKLAPSIKKTASITKNTADASRMLALAKILNDPWIVVNAPAN
ncbi:MAG: LVIVD repeat-containing protein [Pyrinomonadaceae bacterium]